MPMILGRGGEEAISTTDLYVRVRRWSWMLDKQLLGTISFIDIFQTIIPPVKK